MRGEGVLRDHSQRRTWPRQRTLNGCWMKGNIDNVVYIDVDSESLDNVIIIDVSESLHEKIQGSNLGKGKKIHFGGIINIDDDESNGVEYNGPDVEGGADLDSDTSSSKSFPAPGYVHRFVNLGDDECQVVFERHSAFRLSKCMQSYRGKYPSRNRYGLSLESESGSSDSDCSDCELMEGSFGKLHKEWEKASMKRKSNFCRDKSGLKDQANCVNDDVHSNMDAEGEKGAEQYSEASFQRKSSTNDSTKQNSAFVPTDDRELGSSSLNSGLRCSFMESDQKSGQESFPWFKPGLMERVHASRKKATRQFRGETFTKDPSSSSSGCQSFKHADGCSSSFHDEEQISYGPSFFPNEEQGDNRYHTTRACVMGKQKKYTGERLDPQGVNLSFNCKKTNLENEDVYLFKGQQSGVTHANNERVVPSEKCEEFSWTNSSCCVSHQKAHNAGAGFMEKEKPVSEEPMVSSSRPSYEVGAECGVAPEHNVGDAFDESILCNPEVSNEELGQVDKEKPDSDRIYEFDTECAETQSKQENPCSEELKRQVIGSTADSHLRNGRDPIHAQSDVVIPNVQNDIISKREKLKETVEYRRAMEEEWASRKRQLQIQAEEAQRLRKKRRAETIRLIEMERRQKQRLEEIRETQKKDEENMNLKEQLRVEVRKELHRLETTCIDMASLLRALGIHVGGNFHPLSNEVHAAYKRALLRFHPDRASKTDIRQQVEAEEKFKLISRMKEKFLLN